MTGHDDDCRGGQEVCREDVVQQNMPGVTSAPEAPPSRLLPGGICPGREMQLIFYKKLAFLSFSCYQLVGKARFQLYYKDLTAGELFELIHAVLAEKVIAFTDFQVQMDEFGGEMDLGDPVVMVQKPTFGTDPPLPDGIGQPKRFIVLLNPNAGD